MISIVMTYYNRQTLLDKTLESIHRSAVKDYELIIVDDASDPALVCGEAKIIRIEPQDKWWHNPCIPFNMGIREAKGEIIILQNPECYHIGDVLSYARDNITPNLYLSFACYAFNERETETFHTGAIPILENHTFRHPENNGWYNHSLYRRAKYHFCSAIMKDDMDKLGGFDERYAEGVSYDDDDLVKRIQKQGMRVNIVDNPYVIHQYHRPFSYMVDNMKMLHARNKDLYYSTWQK